jgi:hypothetical protein
VVNVAYTHEIIVKSVCWRDLVFTMPIGFINYASQFYLILQKLMGWMACPYRKLCPAVLVVQATEDRYRSDTPGPLDGAGEGSVFLQR